MDAETLARQMLDAVKGYVSRASAALEKRIGEVETLVLSLPTPKDGKDGEKGIDGKDGRDGIDGKDGAPGKVDVEVVRLVVAETLPGMVDRSQAVLAERMEAAIAALPPAKQGEPGKDGEKGLDGANGRDGVDGKDGLNGIDGKDGAPGKDGEKGLDGKDGRDGRDGKDGEAGRDAASIDPLPMIDESRSYPRGTWAKHAGGLWLARSTTDGMSGWDCIVDGVAAIVVSQGESAREVSVTAMLASGLKTVCEFNIPAMIWRDVWRDGNYERGDTVTWDGSLWHCQAATTEKPGNGATNWKLAVKRGNNGRDGKDGKDGVGIPGKEGRPGRDLTQLGFDGVKHG